MIKECTTCTYYKPYEGDGGDLTKTDVVAIGVNRCIRGYDMRWDIASPMFLNPQRIYQTDCDKWLLKQFIDKEVIAWALMKLVANKVNETSPNWLTMSARLEAMLEDYNG